MKISFNGKAGQVFDFYFSLFLVYNRNADENLQKYNIEWSREDRKSYERLIKNTPKPTDKLDLFFHSEIEGFAMFYDADLFWGCDSLEILINMIKSHEHAALKEKMISFLQKQSAISEMIRDEMDFLNNTNLSAEAKWNIINFLHNSDSYMKELFFYLESFYECYSHIIQEVQWDSHVFMRFLNNSIEQEGIDFLKKEIHECISLKKYHEIYVSPVFLCSYMIAVEEGKNENKAYVLLGKDYRKLIHHLSGENMESHMIAALKIIADPTRYQILKLICEKPCYGQEIADRLNLSLATVSHHMELLSVAARAVTGETSGKKVYYTLNREDIKKCIQFFSDVLKL